MFIIYDFIFLLVIIIHLPAYLFKKKFHSGFFARFGFLPKGLALNNPIWVHAVSVGEAMAVKGLIEKIRKTYPAKKMVISTVTATGNKIAVSIAREADFVTYLPLDFSFIVRHCIKTIKPAMVIIAETEIWPNFISCLHHNNIPVAAVNTRISDKSFKRYMAVKFFLKGILNKINIFCSQTESDAKRLLSLGVSKERIRITGNMKFDINAHADLQSDYTDYKIKLGLESGEKLILAGSTHSGEEKIILAVYKKLLSEFPNLRLLIAPRHPERAGEIQKIAEKLNFKAVFISALDQEPKTEHRAPIFILDSVGQLVNYYAVSDIVFVGGSLVKKGGQNILEPAALSKPIIFGPHMFNFRDIADLFLKHKAGILARNEKELEAAVKDLLNNPDEMDGLGKKARQLIMQNQGATGRNLECIEALLERQC